MPFFFLTSDPRWPTGGHFSSKKNPDVEHVLNHFSDMHLPMLFKLGTQITNDGLHMHIIFFFDIKSNMAGWQPFRLLKIKTRCRTRPQPFLGHPFADLVETWHRDHE